MAKKENEESMEENKFVESKEELVEKLRKKETDRLKKREEERQKDLEKKKEERKQTTVNNEQVEFFTVLFNEKKGEIESELSVITSGSMEKSEFNSHFEKITKHIQGLQNYLAASSYFLREYDLRTSKVVLQDLHQKCQELEDKLLPKKKFSFKLRKFPSAKESFDEKLNKTVKSSLLEEQIVDNALLFDESFCGFVQKVGEDLSMSHDVIWKKDVILSHLEKCTILMPGVPSTLHVSGLRNCRVLCGPVMTSIFIEDCLDCTFVLASHQVRIHTTKHCDFYIHAISKAIIEDTKEVRFAPYNWKYNDIDRHFELADLNENVNNWDYIDDFNWLACDKPSPHWRVIDNDERVKDWGVM